MSQESDPVPLVLDPGTITPDMMRYGRGTVRRIVGPSIEASRIDLHINTISVGSAPGPYHVHTNAENVYYVLGGMASIRSGDQIHSAGQGQVVFIPPGVPHSVSNDGDEDLVIIEIYAPADADFKEVD
jgi:mannose-6-phosphate isomerase-like protein (cupin superfamily)